MECASDHLWGTGLSLGDPQCLDHTKWISQGILGQILEDIRNEFKQQERHHYPHYMPTGIAPASILPNTSSDDVTGTMTAVTRSVCSAILSMPDATYGPQASNSTHIEPVNSAPPVQSRILSSDSNTSTKAIAIISGSNINPTEAPDNSHLKTMEIK